MAHPHVNAISKMDAPKLVDIIYESKMSYIRQNLSIHLHESQIKLLKNVLKHQKPHHRKIRVKQYAKIKSDDKHFKIHSKLFLKSYKKLEALNLVEILDVDDLDYDVVLTDYGMQILDEINDLEDKWAEIASGDLDNLRQMALNTFEITYKFKKKQKYQF